MAMDVTPGNFVPPTEEVISAVVNSVCKETTESGANGNVFPGIPYSDFE